MPHHFADDYFDMLFTLFRLLPRSASRRCRFIDYAFSSCLMLPLPPRSSAATRTIDHYAFSAIYRCHFMNVIRRLFYH